MFNRRNLKKVTTKIILVYYQGSSLEKERILFQIVGASIASTIMAFYRSIILKLPNRYCPLTH